MLVIVALGLVWYGAMLALLALKVSPDTVNDISGYRAAYDDLAALGPDDISDRTRLITAVGGLAAFLLFGYLALKELPRPYLTRTGVSLPGDQLGTLQVGPRAVERVAEGAASENPSVSSVGGRYAGADITVNVHLRRARDVPENLRDIQRLVREALDRHGLPVIPVNVTLTGFDRQHRRELR